MNRTEGLSFNIILTDDCFLNCSHCFFGSERRRSGLTLEEVREIVLAVERLSGKCSLNWGGGDPLTLGRSRMKEITSLGCFGNPKVTNGLFSTLLVDLDSGWKSIIERFDSLMFSLDSYHEWGEIKKGLSNLMKLDIREKSISYTPSLSNGEKEVTDFYLMGRDSGAGLFHMGFLHSESPLPGSLYLRLLDILIRLEARHGSPAPGFFHGGSSDKTSNLCGWRAYDCFTRGGYFSQDGIFTSCYILYRSGYEVPYMRTRDFFRSGESIISMNEKFLRKFFILGRPEECRECEYYPLCLGGCPYFTMKGEGKDIYCEVYREIFRHLVSRAKGSGSIL